jgi:hypothetical protein
MTKKQQRKNHFVKKKPLFYWRQIVSIIIFKIRMIKLKITVLHPRCGCQMLRPPYNILSLETNKINTKSEIHFCDDHQNNKQRQANNNKNRLSKSCINLT